MSTLPDRTIANTAAEHVDDHNTIHGLLRGTPYVSVMDHDAVGDGSTNDTTAIQAAITAAGATGTVYLPPGKTFLINKGAIVLAGTQMLGSGATFRVTQTGSGVAVDIGDGTNNYENRHYALPHVVYAGTGSGTSSWQAGSVGVRCRGLYGSSVDLGWVYSFEKGIYMTAGTSSAPCAYGNIRFHTLLDNKVNIYIDGGPSTSYCNEVNYWGGRTGHLNGLGSNITDCHNVKIVKSSTFAADFHRFYGVSMEGDGHMDGRTVHCEGSYNLWHWCRWESTSPGIYFTGSNGFNNTVEGTGAYNVTQTNVSGAGPNFIKGALFVDTEFYGYAQRTKAGTPLDGDYVTTPPVGTMVVDTSANKIWVRTGTATWKGVTVA